MNHRSQRTIFRSPVRRRPKRALGEIDPGPPDGAPRHRRRRRSLLAVLAGLVVGILAFASPVDAIRRPERDEELSELARSDPKLHPSRDLEPLADVRESLPDTARSAWDRFRADRGSRGPWTAHVDRRSGHVEIAQGAGDPWIPGRGNDLTTADIAARLGGRRAPDLSVLESMARELAAEQEPLLGLRGRTLRLRTAASGRYGGNIWIVEFDVLTREGLVIEESRVFFRLNHGNLVQWGAEKIPSPAARVGTIQVDQREALDILASYVDGFRIGTEWLLAEPRLIALPTAAELGNGAGQGYAFGRGYDLRPYWELIFAREGSHATWRARIDAVTAEVAELVDINRYASVHGGMWPVSWRVDGVGQAQVDSGWPFVDITPLGETSNTAGVYFWDGNSQGGYHTGPYVNINDNCTGTPGTASSDADGNIDFGTYDGANGPGDCQIQNDGLGNPVSDNTPSARQQFWHINKIMEKGRTYLTGNTWLEEQITANVNIDSDCNAFWNGSTVNFYTSGGGCNNTGEDAGVSLHEWGHGLDSNDGNGSSLDNGTGETYGDFTAAVQTRDSCIGQGFLGSNCSGYNNACNDCDGVRDIDWGQHVDNVPWTVDGFTQNNCPNDASYVGPCGNKEGHCESYVSSGAVWDFAAYDLQAGCSLRNTSQPEYEDYNCGSNPMPVPGGSDGTGGPYDSAGAWQVADRLWYLSRPTADQAFTCITGGTYSSHGCNAGSNWTTMRLVDDDNGDLSDGTPHSCQLAAAFDRHGIACTQADGASASWNVCFRANSQPTAPTLALDAVANNLVTLSWTPDTSPDVVDVYRNEIGCDAGFTKIAEDVEYGSLPFDDSAVTNGTTYYYQVIRHGVGDEANHSPPSNCVSGTPTAGPSAVYVTGSATLDSVTVDNDSDGIADNCETGRASFQVYNDGDRTLTDVRATITSLDTAFTVTSSMPVTVAASLDPPGGGFDGRASATFDFSVDGATCGQLPAFAISVTSDEMQAQSPAVSKDDIFELEAVELSFVAGNHTNDFETDTDGWSLEGFGREDVIADSGTWSVHSTDSQNGTCDVAESPRFKPQTGAQVTLAIQYDIEGRAQGQWWDRANVHVVEVATGNHTLLFPSSGNAYNASGNAGAGLCHIDGEDGWADADTTWGDVVFDLSGLTVGDEYYLEVNYNTDAAVAEPGFWYDHVRWTSVELLGCDAQSDSCSPCTPPDAPTNLTATSTIGSIDLSWDPVSPQPAEYRIYRATDSAGPYSQIGSVAGGTTTFSDTTGTSGTTYYYVVRAFDECESADSNVASATFEACATPSTPTGLEATADAESQITLTWTAVTADSYDVLRSTTSGGPYTTIATGVPTATYTDGSVTPDTEYFYVVQAHNDPDCDSGSSNEASAVAWGDCTAAPSFTGVSSVSELSGGQGCGLRVDWDAGTSNCGGDLVYNVYRSTSPGFTPDAGTLLASCVAATAFDDTGVTTDTTYHYQVYSEDTAGSGGGACGGGSVDANTAEASGALTSGTSTLLSENFDAVSEGSLPGGWLDTTFSSGNDFQGARTCAGQSSPKVLRYGGDFGNGQFRCTRDTDPSTDGGAITSGISIPAGASNVEWTFYHRFQWAAGNGGHVWVSNQTQSDVGSFVLVPSIYLTGQDYTGTTTTGNGFTGQSAGFLSDTMVTTTVDLSGFCNAQGWGTDCENETLYLAWNGFTDGDNDNLQGWFLDDVTVTHPSGSTCSTAPSALQFFTATGKDSQVTVEWLNPDDSPYGTTEIRTGGTADFPADPADGTLVTRQADGGVGAHGETTVAGLINGSTHHYGGFVDDGTGVYSARKVTQGFPVDTTGNEKWNLSTRAAALAQPGHGSSFGVSGIFAASNSRALHAMAAGSTGGTWPSGWKPLAMNAPAQDQPMVLAASWSGLAHDAVFLSSQDGHLYCVDAASGDPCPTWLGPDSTSGTADDGESAEDFAMLQATPVLYAGNTGTTAGERWLLVGSRDSTGTVHGLHAIEVADGTTAWTFENRSADQGGDDLAVGVVSGSAYADPSGETVYFASRSRAAGSGNTLWRLDLSSGSPVLTHARDLGGIDGSVTRDWESDGGAGRILVGTNAGDVYSLDPADLATVWSRTDLDDGPVKGFVYYSSSHDRLFLATTSTVWGLPAADGTTGGDWSVSGLVAPTRPLQHFDTSRVYFGACATSACDDGALYEVDNDAGGANPWSASKSLTLTGTGGLGAVIIDRNQSPAVLHAGSRSGRVVAVEIPLP